MASASAHSFGLGNAAFAPIAPPDIFDLDAWMDREHWDLGRLTDHEAKPVPVLQRLDNLIAAEGSLGRQVEQIVSLESASHWSVARLSTGGSEIQIPSQVLKEIFRTLFQQRDNTRPVVPSAYKGIPVIELPF